MYIIHSFDYETPIEETMEDIAQMEEPYLPHRIVGAIDHNPADGVMLLDEKSELAKRKRRWLSVEGYLLFCPDF